MKYTMYLCMTDVHHEKMNLNISSFIQYVIITIFDMNQRIIRSFYLSISNYTFDYIFSIF